MEHMTKAELEESVKRYSLSTNDVSRDIIQEIHPASRLGVMKRLWIQAIKYPPTYINIYNYFI